jgi:hypothetical protein
MSGVGASVAIAQFRAAQLAITNVARINLSIVSDRVDVAVVQHTPASEVKWEGTRQISKPVSRDANQTHRVSVLQFTAAYFIAIAPDPRTISLRETERCKRGYRSAAFIVVKMSGVTHGQHHGMGSLSSYRCSRQYLDRQQWYQPRWKIRQFAWMYELSCGKR